MTPVGERYFVFGWFKYDLACQMSPKRLDQDQLLFLSNYFYRLTVRACGCAFFNTWRSYTIRSRKKTRRKAELFIFLIA